MTPLMPLSPASRQSTSTSGFTPKPQPNARTTNATTRPSRPMQKPQDSDLQNKANDDTLNDAKQMESQISPMTTAITLQIFVIVLVVIAGTSLLFFRRKRRRACYAKSHGSEGRKRGDGNLFSKIGRQAGLSGGKRHNEVAGEKDSTSVSVHKLDVDEQPPVQQIPERVLVRESLDAPKWLPQLPSHQDIGLHNSVATAAPPSRGSLAQSNPTGTLQRLRENLTVAEDPISLPPRALFTRQSTVSSNYSESVVSSAPSSRPSTIVYASPLRPRPTARNAPR